MVSPDLLCSCHGDPAPKDVPFGPHTYVTHRSVCYGVSPRDVRGPKRDRYLVNVRRQIAGELRGKGLSYPAIGQALGGRDHTTIMSLLKKKIDG